MSHFVFHKPQDFLVVILIAIYLKSHPVTSISISPDTLKTIEYNHVYKDGYNKAVKADPQYYRATSSVGLIRLAKLDQKIFEAIQNLTRSNSSTCPKLNKSIKEYMEDYVTSSAVLTKLLNATEDQVKAQVVAGNLIGAYRVVRRIRNYVPSWKALSFKNDSSLSQAELDFLATINSLKSDRQKEGPLRRDFHFTMIAIILTQFQLDWKPEDIAKGVIGGMELGATFQAAHCVDIGVHAVASLMYPVGIEWLQLAVLKIQNGDNSVQLAFALSLLEKAKFQHDLKWQPFNGIDMDETYYERRLNKTTDKMELKWQRKPAPDPRISTREENDVERLWDVCSGKLHQTELEKSKLFCWHESKTHPTWTIGPLKVELHYASSFEIVQFYDVFGKNLIEGVQETCESRLYPVSIMNDQDLHPKKVFSETCVPPFDCPHMMQTLQLSGRITGMSTSPLRSWHTHTTLHPPGGHARGHLDRIHFHDHIAMATIGFCVEGPTIGGETGFSFAKVAFKCTKGSAIFWFNTFKSSEMHYDAVHAGCPVIQGQKYTTVHLIRYHHQTHLLCDLDQNSRLEYLVNGKSKYRQL